MLAASKDEPTPMAAPQPELSLDELDELLSGLTPEIPGYRVLRRIGRGGMSYVYLAVQESLNRQVAIKLIAPDALKDEVGKLRFEKEARTIAKLVHPCIVGIHEIGRTEHGLLYYVLPYLPRGHLRQRDLRNDEDAIDNLEALLSRAIELQRVADVPLGAFLSGGIDSSAVVALMQAHAQRPVRTFTIGFEEAAYDESHHARAVADHLGTDHTELRVTPVEAMAVIQDLPTLYDEPFGDSSAIPTYLVAGLARRHVTVALSGDGGDELFAGYYRYQHAHRVWSGVQRLAPIGRRWAGSFAAAAERTLAWAPGAGAGGRVLVRQRFGTLRAAVADTIAPLYKEHMSLWREPERALQEPAGEQLSALTDGVWPLARRAVDHMTFTDAVSYLPDDILVKVDRAAMAVSLETRVPLLDHRVVEFAWRLPSRFKVRSGETKWLLRRVLERHVPREIFERPKMGFGVPIDQWVRGPLRPWAEELLASDRLRREGLFDPHAIRGRWHDHLTGKRDWQYSLWPVLVFQAWLEHERA